MQSPSNATNYTELHNAVKNQNEIIDVEVTRLDNLYSTNNREATFTTPKYQRCVYINFFLWIIYYVLAMFCLYYIFNGKDQGYTRSTQIMFCILFLVFPMIVLSIELLLYKCIMYLYSLFTGSPYQLEQNNKPPFSLLDIMPPGYY